VAVAPLPPPSLSPTLPPDPAAARWAAACAVLSETVTPAALNAWLLPLTPVALVAPTAPDVPERLVLACASAFQREHVARRYREAIEAAAGAACELVVQPRADDARPEPC
jgi:hypothetical protein